MEAFAECVESRTALAEEFKALGVLFSALGDENRQRVLATLLVSDQIGIRTGEIAERAHLSRQAVSRHLRLLREAGAVGVYRQGTRSYYYPAPGECWRRLQALSTHICAAVETAAGAGYPHFEEEEI